MDDQEPGTQGDDPVTMVVSRRVRRGREADYERWIEGIIGAAREFEGHRGAEVIRPSATGDPEYVVVLKFDRYADLKRWARSDVRARWLERAEPLTRDTNVQVVSGLEPWFTLPGQPRTAAPARYKMALLTTAALYPLLLLAGIVLEPLLGGLPAPLSLLLSTTVLVLLMTYVIMPQVTRLFARWLYPWTRGERVLSGER